MFLMIEKDHTSKQFDDDQWIRSLAEAQEIRSDVPEDSVMCDQQEVDPKKVRPSTTSGSQAHSTNHWPESRHRDLSHLEQEELAPMPKDREAEQRDIDGPLECSLALGMIAAEARGCVAAHQTTGNHSWIGVDDPADVHRLQADHAVRQQEAADFQLGYSEKLHLSRRQVACAVEKWRCGGHVAHGTMVTCCAIQSWCHPTCRNSTLPTPKMERSGTHRKLRSSTTWTTWIGGVQNMAKVSTVTAGSMPFGPVGSRSPLLPPSHEGRDDLFHRRSHL